MSTEEVQPQEVEIPSVIVKRSRVLPDAEITRTADSATSSTDGHAAAVYIASSQDDYDDAGSDDSGSDDSSIDDSGPDDTGHESAASPDGSTSEPGGQTARRRRRRRRKGKGAASPEMQQRPPQQQQQAPRQKQPQQPPRVFQRRDNPGNQNPGNQIQPMYSNGNGGGAGRKQQKRKQRAPKVFVGPMDHSYREVNGNIDSGPPSTMSYSQNGHSNGNGNYFADFNSNYGAPTARPVVDDAAPTRIFCFIEDLFFIAKIQETAKKTGVKVTFLKSGDKEVLAQLTECPEEDRPALIVFDLNNANIKPLAIIPKLKAKLKKDVSIIGFLSHLQGDLKLKAMEAGCDTVMPKSAFSQGLPNLLRRYGLEEEEDNYPQPV